MNRLLFSMCLILAVSAVGSAQQFTYYYPHVTAGTFVGGFWQTTIFLTNPNPPGTPAASGAVVFTRSDGGPYAITFHDDVNRPAGSGNTIPFQLGPGETRKYVSVANEPLSTGFATVTANSSILGTAMFTQFDSFGRMIGEAGVPAAIPLGRQAIFVDTTSQFKTGLAIANPNNAPLHITFQLMNTVGQMILTTTRELPPNQHFSIFVHELFPGAPPMVGRLQFYCTNPMVSVALRFDPTFTLFTTMPPVAIAGLIKMEAQPANLERRRMVIDRA